MVCANSDRRRHGNTWRRSVTAVGYDYRFTAGSQFSKASAYPLRHRRLLMVETSISAQLHAFVVLRGAQPSTVTIGFRLLRRLGSWRWVIGWLSKVCDHTARCRRNRVFLSASVVRIVITRISFRWCQNTVRDLTIPTSAATVLQHHL